MYDQTLNFNPKKMGTRPGWCLMNCRLGFGIQRGCFPSAKADMESQKKNKTLHPINTLPTNCAVPVYADTTNVYEHVVVYDKGTWYEDGRKIKKPNYKWFGWGELCDGVRVVKAVKKKKTNQQIAQEVIQGLWGNGKERKIRLEKAGYNYNVIQGIVNKMLGY